MATPKIRVIGTAARLATMMAALGTAPGLAASADDLAIRSFPIGLVVGEQIIEVDLGPSSAPAELLLDGRKVCDLDLDADRCAVDLGPDVRVHLLELVRRSEAGAVTARHHRWVNRPGQESELGFQFTARESSGVCGGKTVWLHPDKLRPSLLQIRHNGRVLRIGDDGRSFAYPCPDPSLPAILEASAIFPDGRRAECVALTGGFGGREHTTMTAAALVGETLEGGACGAIGARLNEPIEIVGDAGFEIVFVLDPSAGYRGLLGSAGRQYFSNSSWRRADASLWDADRIWLVLPNQALARIDAHGANSAKGFRNQSGKLNWLTNLFEVANQPVSGDTRLADAVAASGLVAAAGPRRRAIVLILGNRADRDASLFTPHQAMAYLDQIGVPLHVVRIGKIRDDGWPRGDRTLAIREFADALEDLKKSVDRQCIAWFQGDQSLDHIAAHLPEGVFIAGRRSIDEATK